MSDKEFWGEFKKNMEAMGLPAPNSLFSSVTTALGTLGGIASAIKTYGTSVTVSEVFLSIPLGASATAAAAGVSELIAVGGALAASFYLGACIGSLIMAVNETYGDWVGSHIAKLLGEIQDDLGIALDVFIANTIQANPVACPIRVSVTLAKRV